MTVKAMWNLYCDDCGQWEPHDTTGMKSRQVQQRAASLGWHRWKEPYPFRPARVLDLCPVCWEKRETEVSE